MVDQLWYTWSSVGLGMATGYRVRAASPGIADLKSERYKTLDRYLRYSLPKGVNAFTTLPEEAPICLAFLNAGDERILVNKRFAGKDDFGRPGNYFIHLAAGLPPTFSAKEAIQCWKSPFWQYTDRALSATELTLEPIDDEALNTTLFKGSLSPLNLREVQAFLPFVIQAFLSKSEHQRICIVAYPEKVAALVWGLANCLPRVLLDQLTFSTYERDFENSPCTVVGTYWASLASENPGQEDLIPSSSYRQQAPVLAINCHTGKKSPLENIPYAESFANFAARCLLGENPQELVELLDLANTNKRIKNTFWFLNLYHLFTSPFTDVGEAERLTKEEFMLLLESPQITARLFMQETVRGAIAASIDREPLWWKSEGFARLRNLRLSAERQPDGTNLAAALATLGPIAFKKAAAALQANGEGADGWIELLTITAPAANDASFWTLLLRATEHPEALPWAIHAALLRVWSTIPHVIRMENLRPWLVVSWDKLGELLELRLPPDWYGVTLEALLAPSSSPPPPLLLKQRNAQLEEILQQLIRNREQERVAATFFTKLAEHNYAGKMALLYQVLDAGITEPEVAETLLKSAKLTALEMVTLLNSRTQSFLQQAFAQLILNNRGEWITGGMPLIRGLRAHSSFGIERGVTGALQELTDLVVPPLASALVQGPEDKAIFYFEVLYEAAPPTIQNNKDSWLKFIHLVGERPRHLSGNLRFRLLSQWKEVSRSIPEALLASWLDIGWNEVDELLRARLPTRWNEIGLTTLLEKHSTMLPSEASSIVERHRDWFEYVLSILIKDSGKPVVATNFFDKLIAAGYPQKRSMLYKLLDSSATFPTSVDVLLSSAKLSRDEIIDLVEEHSQQLLRAPNLSGEFGQIVQKYIGSLEVDHDADRLARNRYAPVESLRQYRLKHPGETPIAEGLSHLAQTAKEEVLLALLARNDHASVFWINLLSISALPTEYPEPWLALLDGLSTRPETPSTYWLCQLLRLWGMIAWLIEPKRFSRFITKITWDDLEEVLRVNLPSATEWLDQICVSLIQRQTAALSEGQVGIVFRYQVRFGVLLKRLIQDPATEPIALNFFKKLATAGYTKKLDLLCSLLECVAEDHGRAKALLEAAQLGSDEASEFLQNQLKLLRALPTLTPFIEQELRCANESTAVAAPASVPPPMKPPQVSTSQASQAASSKSPAKTEAFLESMSPNATRAVQPGQREQPVDQRQLASAHQQLRPDKGGYGQLIDQFLRKPVLDQNTLQELKQAIQRLPSQQRGSKLTQELAQALARQIHTEAQLDTVVTSLSQPLSRGQYGFLEPLARAIDKKPSSQHDFLQTAILYTKAKLRYMSEKTSSDQSLKLEDILGALERTSRKRNRLISQISKAAVQWPEQDLRARWDNYVRTLPPSQPSGFLRHLKKWVEGPLTPIFLVLAIIMVILYLLHIIHFP